MARLLFFIGSSLTLTAFVLGECTFEGVKPFFKRSTYEFSLKLLKRIGEDSNYHFLASPFSIWTLLSTLSLAAEGESFKEIKQVLRLHPHVCFNKKFFEVAKDIIWNKPDVTMERASSIFIDERLSVRNEFLETVRATEVTNASVISFDSFEETASQINKIVGETTQNNIGNVISSSDLQRVFVILIDALHFKGKWQMQFDRELSRVDTFYDENDDPIKDVTYMYLEHKFATASVSLIQASVLELPYGSNGRFVMLIFLPDESVSVKSVLESMDKISLSSVFQLLKNNIRQQIKVQLPRFQLSSSMKNLQNLLESLGLKTMFKSGEAEFTQMSDFALNVGSVIQKAIIEVTEEGTTASVASENEFVFRTMINEFVVNKPFIFMIVDKDTEIALFSGIYSNPHRHYINLSANL